MARLAGVPIYAIESYLAKLMKLGESVATRKHCGGPATSKGPVGRKVTHIIAPGTVTDANLLDAKRDSLLVAVSPDPPPHGTRVATPCIQAVHVRRGAACLSRREALQLLTQDAFMGRPSLPQ